MSFFHLLILFFFIHFFIHPSILSSFHSTALSFFYSSISSSTHPYFPAFASTTILLPLFPHILYVCFLHLLNHVCPLFFCFSINSHLHHFIHPSFHPSKQLSNYVHSFLLLPFHSSTHLLIYSSNHVPLHSSANLFPRPLIFPST